MPLEAQKQIAQEIQNLSPSAVIEMFVLEVGETSDTWVYFHAGTNQLYKNIIWQGQTYVALPITTEGFDINTQGTLPRPKLSIANVQGLFSALIRQYDDLVGVKIIRKRTFAKYLDAVNFPNGNPTADPNAFFPDDIGTSTKRNKRPNTASNGSLLRHLTFRVFSCLVVRLFRTTVSGSTGAASVGMTARTLTLTTSLVLLRKKTSARRN